jgi:hypothetical protein
VGDQVVELVRHVCGCHGGSLLKGKGYAAMAQRPCQRVVSQPLTTAAAPRLRYQTPTGQNPYLMSAIRVKTSIPRRNVSSEAA